MELLSGPSLRDEIAARGRLDPADVQRIVPGICAALQVAHDGGVVHRDLKPANIVAHEYAPGQRVYKLVDFGVANLRQSAADARLTDAHQFVGTVAYAAPEQISAREVDARTDVYALAAVVYEMLTGALPFGDGDLMAIVTRKIGGRCAARAHGPSRPAGVARRGRRARARQAIPPIAGRRPPSSKPRASRSAGRRQPPSRSP